MTTPNEGKAEIVYNQEVDPELGSLYAHLESESSTAISTTSGREAIYVKPDLLAILPEFWGPSDEGPIEFLHEFSKICRVQKRLTGSSEDDFKLKVIPLSLKGEANAWFRRLLANSINTWSDFRGTFLEQFFPAAKTNALWREIKQATQGCDESLSRYWYRYRGLLDACPNHNMMEVEIYSRFYEGMDARNKDLVNSSSGGSFSKLRVSEAKVIMEKLLCAKRAYDDILVALTQGSVMKTSAREDDDKLKSRVDKLERAFQSVIETSHPQALSAKINAPTDQVGYHQGAGEIWSSNRSWNLGRQADACQDEYLNCSGRESSIALPQGSWTGECPSFPHQPEPYPYATHMPTCQMENQDYQLCPDFLEYEPSQPVHHLDYPSHYPSFQNHLHQPWLANFENHFPIWPGEDRQAQNLQSYQS